MGITRSGRHKRRKTGGRRSFYRKKRKYEMGRPPANTKIGEKRVKQVRVRGGGIKHRALRLDSGNFSWGSEVCTRKVRVLDVVYNATSNELVRTKTLVKGAIIVIDSTPFRLWYESHYGVKIGLKKDQPEDEAEDETKGEEVKKPKVKKIIAERQKYRELAPELDDQFATGRILARISSRPGQVGRCDGYILEGPELAFYWKKIHTK